MKQVPYVNFCGLAIKIPSDAGRTMSKCERVGEKAMLLRLTLLLRLLTEWPS